MLAFLIPELVIAGLAVRGLVRSQAAAFYRHWQGHEEEGAVITQHNTLHNNNESQDSSEESNESEEEVLAEQDEEEEKERERKEGMATGRATPVGRRAV